VWNHSCASVPRELSRPTRGACCATDASGVTISSMTHPILERLLAGSAPLSVIELPASLTSWIVVDGLSTAPAALAATAERLGLRVDRPGTLRLIVSDGTETLRLAFEPSGDELAAAAVAAALILDGTVEVPDSLTPDADLVDRILDAGWQVPAEARPLASVATRLLLDRVQQGAARWEIELAIGAEPSVLDLARRVDAIER
jgi:hypothetical protein